MKVGEKWKDNTSGAIGAIERIEGDYVTVRLDDGGNVANIQRDTFLTHWDRRKFDLQTQDRVRELIRSNNVLIPPDILKQPFHVLSIYSIAGDVGSVPALVQQQADENARRPPWVIDIGTCDRMVDENQAKRIQQTCEEEGIPFWKEDRMDAHEVLHNPLVFPHEHRELCDKFGPPVPAILNN